MSQKPSSDPCHDIGSGNGSGGNSFNKFISKNSIGPYSFSTSFAYIYINLKIGGVELYDVNNSSQLCCFTYFSYKNDRCTEKIIS
jgi:hypothetical protein